MSSLTIRACLAIDASNIPDTVPNVYIENIMRILKEELDRADENLDKCSDDYHAKKDSLRNAMKWMVEPTGSKELIESAVRFREAATWAMHDFEWDSSLWFMHLVVCMHELVSSDPDSLHLSAPAAFENLRMIVEPDREEVEEELGDVYACYCEWKHCLEYYVNHLTTVHDKMMDYMTLAPPCDDAKGKMYDASQYRDTVCQQYMDIRSHLLTKSGHQLYKPNNVP